MVSTEKLGNEGRQVVKVNWSSGDVTKVLDANIEFCPRGRITTAHRRMTAAVHPPVVIPEEDIPF